MSQISGSADFLYSIGGDTSALEASIVHAERMAKASFQRITNDFDARNAMANRRADQIERQIDQGMLRAQGMNMTAELHQLETQRLATIQQINDADNLNVYLKDHLIRKANQLHEAQVRQLDESQRSLSLIGTGIQRTVGHVTAAIGIVGFVSGSLFGVFQALEHLATAGERRAQRMKENIEEVNRIAFQTRESLDDLGRSPARRFDISGELERLSQVYADGVKEIANLDLPESVQNQRIESIGERATQARIRLEQANAEAMERALLAERDRIAIQQLRAQGLDREADALKRQYEQRDAIQELLELETALIKAENIEAAAEVRDIIVDTRAAYEDLNTQAEKALDLAERRAEAEQRAAQFAQEEAAYWAREGQMQSAERLRMQLQERIYRQQGKEDLADQIAAQEEILRIREQIEALPMIPQQDRWELERLLQQAMQVSPTENPETGPRFGASVGGSVGSTAAAQVLGGTANITQQMDRQRNTTLASMDRSLKELVRNSNAGGTGTAVFS